MNRDAAPPLRPPLLDARAAPVDKHDKVYRYVVRLHDSDEVVAISAGELVRAIADGTAKASDYDLQIVAVEDVEDPRT